MTTTRGIALLATMTLILGSAACGGDGDEAGIATSAGIPDGPHPVIVVAVDGLRADRVRCGSEGPTDTPNLDALASESICFTQAFTQYPAAIPALASILTGTYPTTHSLDDGGESLPPEAESVAEVAAGAGIPTAGFVTGTGGGAAFGLEQGFDSFEAAPAPLASAATWIVGHADGPFLVVGASFALSDVRAIAEAAPDAPEGLRDRALEAVTSQFSDDEPVQLGDADLDALTEGYDALLTQLDATLGELRVTLADAGLDERATLVLVGTTGFALQEHGDLQHGSLYPAVSRVPLMVRLPGGAMAQTVDKVVEILDLAPTVGDLLGLAPLQGAQASSLLPLIEGAGSPPYIAFGEAPGSRFVALGGYQMVADADGGDPELFHLATDPLGDEDIAAREPERVEVLQGHLEAWDKMVRAASLDPELRSEELDDDTLEQLKSLGYIQ